MSWAHIRKKLNFKTTDLDGCLVSHFHGDHVNGLLRDRRFGRQILHVATREELGMPAPQDHVRHFDAAEAWSLLELEPPEHTRLRTLVNRAFVSRTIENEAERQQRRLIHELSAFEEPVLDFALQHVVRK